MFRASLIAVVVVALLASACTGSVEFSFGGQTASEAAVELIEGDAMSQRLALDSITDANCVEPESDEDGAVFTCTAISGGEVIEFDVTIEPDDRIFAAPTNVVAASFMSGYATSAVAALNNENDLTFAADSMDCGTESVVLNADRQMTCLLEDADAGVVYNAVLTVRDVNLGTFGVEIDSIAE